jgi:hypothetical protein
VQLVRQIPERFGRRERLLLAAGELMMPLRQVRWQPSLDGAKRDREGRELLCDVVVKLAPDPAALLFLRGDEPSGQVLDLPIAREQRCFDLLAFDTEASGKVIGFGGVFPAERIDLRLLDERDGWREVVLVLVERTQEDERRCWFPSGTRNAPRARPLVAGRQQQELPAPAGIGSDSLTSPKNLPPSTGIGRCQKSRRMPCNCGGASKTIGPS